jgi:hypothetical protein
MASGILQREICCEDGRWMELAQDRVQWQALVLAVLNLGVLLPELANCVADCKLQATFASLLPASYCCKEMKPTGFN